MSDKKLDNNALDTIFRTARTYTAWQDKAVEDATLHDLYELMKWGPTSANCSPLRVIFVKSPAQKEALKPHLDAGNVEKTMKAPVTAILALDKKFYEYMPKLFPHADAKSWFVGNQPKIDETAFRNGTLQAGYLIVAARALGLDCGPMSGFNKEGVKNEFFKDQEIEVNFLCNLGYGDPSTLYPRGPRLAFDEGCKIV